ncbi:MAG TPA: NADPH:quinone oxidoreductase family protein [Jatrophihabitans sp.]|jgi:NADPH2:quinone reductase
MRAAVVREYGTSEVVRVEDGYPAPPIQPRTVRVRIAAAAVNFSDVLITAGKYQMPAPLPFIPGSEYSGTVVEVGEVGEGVTSVAVGDQVLGAVFIGAFAEEIVAEASTVTKLPEGVDLQKAAAFGVAHRTAFHALRGFARIQPGEELVVLGAGGGVGLAAVQLGAVLGARVTAVASSAEKLEAARSVGAAALLNYKDGDLRQQLKVALPGGADVVIDPVGGALSEPALRSLRWRGRFVTLGYAGGEIPRIPLNLVLLKGVAVTGFQFIDYLTRAPAEMAEGDAQLMQLLAAGKAVPQIGASFAFEDVAAAMKHVEDGRAIGKVLVTF